MDRNVRSALSPTAAVLLVVAPLVMAVGRLLLVPFNDQGWNAVLTHAADHQNMSDTGWLLAMAASGLLGATALYLAELLRVAGRTRAAAFAAVTTALGWAGSAGMCTGGLLLSYQGQTRDRAVQVKLLQDFNAGHSAFVFLMCVLGTVGYIVLAVGLLRSRAVGRSAAALIAVGGGATLLTGPGPLKALLVLAALLLLAGHILVIRTPGGVPATAVEPEAVTVS
jgi:hypothetical protein